MEFKVPTDDQSVAIIKAVLRNRSQTPSIAQHMTTATIAVREPTMDSPFTTVFIRADNKIYVGSSKRTTYARRADAPNPVIGEAIAIKRALISEPVSV
jgi:hypothetical protein